MRRITTIILAATFAAVGCDADGDGHIEVERPVVDVDIGTEKDTLELPTVGTRKDTVVIRRPTVDPPR